MFLHDLLKEACFKGENPTVPFIMSAKLYSLPISMREHLFSRFGHDYRSPGRRARCLHPGNISDRVRGEGRDSFNTVFPSNFRV